MLRSSFRPRRLLALVFLAAALAPLYLPGEPTKVFGGDAHFTLTRLDYDAPPQGAIALGGVWHIASADSRLGSYSSLVALPGGRLRAYADTDWWLSFAPPGSGRDLGARFAGNVDPDPYLTRDVESATRDPATGATWLGAEGDNEIRRFDAQDRFTGRVAPPAMANWAKNGGPEAMTRLPDGRFLVLAEANTWRYPMQRAGLLFPRDPLQGGKPVEFAFRPPVGFDPTEMAVLPDGRVLILLRKLTPSLDGLFASRILIADPRGIAPGKPWPWRKLVDVNALAPPENYEGMAVVPGKQATTIWLISDANKSARIQRTLLVKLIWNE